MLEGVEKVGGHNGQVQRGREFEKIFKDNLPKNDHSPEAVKKFDLMQERVAERLHRVAREFRTSPGLKFLQKK